MNTLKIMAIYQSTGMETYLTWSSFFRKDVNSTKSTSCSFDFDFFVLLGIGSM